MEAQRGRRAFETHIGRNGREHNAVRGKEMKETRGAERERRRKQEEEDRAKEQEIYDYELAMRLAEVST